MIGRPGDQPISGLDSSSAPPLPSMGFSPPSLLPLPIAMAAAAGTWAFAFPAVQRMRQLLLQGGSATASLQEAMAGDG